MISTAEYVTENLSCISKGSEIILKTTSGKETFFQVRKVFPGGIDSDFSQNLWNIPGTYTPQTRAQVYRFDKKDGIFRDIFLSASDNLDHLCLEPEQIRQFVTEYSHWLHPGGIATLVLLRSKNNSDYSVAWIDETCLGLRLRRFNFSLKSVWNCAFGLYVIIPES
ncbi:MAG: hypothetical protein WAV11_02665 [Minisyncoccia bacterium]